HGGVDLREQARELETASRYKSEFVANMSHELRTPLNALLIMARLLADNRPGNLTEEQVSFAQTISDTTWQGARLDELILDQLRLGTLDETRIAISGPEV